MTARDRRTGRFVADRCEGCRARVTPAPGFRARCALCRLATAILRQRQMGRPPYDAAQEIARALCPHGAAGVVCLRCEMDRCEGRPAANN